MKTTHEHNEENDFKIKELTSLELENILQSEDIIFKDDKKDLQEFVDFLNADEDSTIYD